MVKIKILGPGCSRCERLENAVQRVVTAQGLSAEIEKVTDEREIMKWPILFTPGLVVNDKLVASARIPRDDEIVGWLTT